MPALTAGVSFTDLAAYATHLVVRAARQLGPAPVVVAAIPSLDALVYHVHVGDLRLVAKVSVLGVPLAVALRGTYGDIGQLNARMAAYTRTSADRAAEQQQHLLLLADAGLNTVSPAGAIGGVLFTHAVDERTPLSEILRTRPERAEELLGTVLTSVRAALRSRDLAKASLDVPGCKITSSLLHGLGASSNWAYFLGQAGRLSGPRVPGIVAVLDATVRRLVPLVRSLEGPRGLVYGALHPDHILVGDAAQSTPVLLSPSLQRGPLEADLARLISRTVLGVVTDPHPQHGSEPVFHAIDQLVAGLTAVRPPHARDQMLRGLLTLWAADTASTLAAVLTTPRSVPVPAGALAIADQATVVCTLLHRVTNAAMAYAGGLEAAWKNLLADLPDLR
ncbi:hypothetical protein [Streptomyces sp. NPDC089795]|uniref:hypothetical protein n=1 Tax=Streptomyces sp. NPDC089795 TaxID=3155297 RepID=UPI00341A102F